MATSATTNSRSFSAGGTLLQGSFTSRVRKPAEVMLVPMIDIFVVLVTFLLMTAVFSRVTILQLDLPSAEDGGPPALPAFRLEVIVREGGFELTNGETLIATVPKTRDGEYDFATLTQLAAQLKRENPEVDDASVLLERQVKYDYLIQVMDAIRSAEQPVVAGADVQDPARSMAGDWTHDGAHPERIALFTDIALGDAP
ncbi:MAG: ExbD/TolR family protein [Steroidobacteraceae bacterium]